MIRHPHYADQIVLYDGQGKLIEQYSDQGGRKMGCVN